MAIKLNISKSLFAPKFFPLLFDYSTRWEVYMGSAGSAKSYFITQKLILRATREKKKILVFSLFLCYDKNGITHLRKVVKK